jgi:hypothetical protein
MDIHVIKIKTLNWWYPPFPVFNGYIYWLNQPVNITDALPIFSHILVLMVPDEEKLEDTKVDDQNP